MPSLKTPTDLNITRLYNAPVKQVWEAWVDPALVSQWWGPRGFTITTERKVVNTGGDWLCTMHGPDGVNYPNHTRFIEVEPGQRLVYDHGGFEDQPPMFRVQVRFSEQNAHTKMEMVMSFASEEAAANAQIMIKKANGDSTWDRLAEFLEKQRSGKDVFVINRSFEVGIETMYQAWTDPEQIMDWTAPAGMSGRYLKADVRPGGESFYEMSGNGVTMYGKANYLEMTEPNRIVYTQVFADKDGNIARHPMAPTWPETMKTTVTLSEEGPKQTRVTLVWEVFGEAKPEEHAIFGGAKMGMMQGWTGSLDKLDAHLKNK